MSSLEYRGSTTMFHGPCEIVDAPRPNFYKKGRYTISVPSPISNGTDWDDKYEILIRVRPESIYIV